MDSSIIVIDDERDFLESIRRGLVTSGYRNIHVEPDARAAARRFEDGEDFDIALIDITMPGMTGIELLSIIKSASPQTECIMVTAIDEARVAVDCLKNGAYDYLVKPISKEDLLKSVRRAQERKHLFDIIDLGKRKTLPALRNREAFAPIVTQSSAVQRLLREAELHARSDVPILVSGETGTGKELLARAIHQASSRSRHPFTAINMDAVDGTLFGAEFFGHTRGAFTGAEDDRAGFLETTHKGTLFLDEIGNLPFELQGKLLRVLQSGEFIKLGTSRPQKADIRIIAATNEDLEKLMARKRFRKDLYYRLRGAWLDLPPLRERAGDIPLLINHFFAEFCERPEACTVEDDAVETLMEYPFPGNIRELKAIVHAALNLSQGRGLFSRFLPESVRKSRNRHPGASVPGGPDILPLAELERRHILHAYQATDRNKSQTARILDVSLSTLRRKLESYGID
ncbi:MAG: sigma-54-dependent transcriptional regulator [Desulfobacterales bacterium]